MTVTAEIDLSALFRRLEGMVRAYTEEVRRGALRDLRRAEYERDDARRNEIRANDRLQHMKVAIAIRDAEIATLREQIERTRAYETL